MFFISSKKLFLLSRYSDFCISVLPSFSPCRPLSLTILGVMEILCRFRLLLEGKTGKEIPESSRKEFLEKISANNFILSDAEDNTSGLLNRGGTADLPFLRTLLAIRQKFLKPSFWEVMDYFVLLV